MYILADERVNLRRRSIVRYPRMNHHRFRAGLLRKVAFVADAHNLAVEPEREQDFRGRWKQRNNSHQRGMYHICKNEEEQELATDREGFESKISPKRNLPAVQNGKSQFILDSE